MKIKIIALTIALMLLFTSCSEQKESSIKSEKTEHIIAAWINYNEIKELISEAENYEQFYSVIADKLNILKKYGVNTVFLHARAFDDCFYNSAIFPVSDYAADTDGKLKFDVLKAFTEAANASGTDIHAWINPYRVRNDGDTEKIKKNTLAFNEYESGNKNQALIIGESYIYYNPASLEAQKRILDCVKEIIENYDIKGIHIDDYFYPSTENTIDNKYYESYKESGGKLSVADYRRQCVNTLMSSIYTCVKSYNNDLIFSVSPSAVIDNNVDGCYADVRLWASEKGYCDWIIPQIYFGFQHSTVPFDKTVSEWTEITGEDVKIIIGLAVYKSGKQDIYAGSGASEWSDSKDIIAKQISYLKTKAEISGFSYYSASYLYNDKCKEENINILKAVKDY